MTETTAYSPLRDLRPEDCLRIRHTNERLGTELIGYLYPPGAFVDPETGEEVVATLETRMLGRVGTVTVLTYDQARLLGAQMAAAVYLRDASQYLTETIDSVATTEGDTLPGL